MSDFKIQIKDFQSLENVDITIETGINVIVGKTNIGKSAIIRALDSAIFNTGKDEMVRAGNRYAGVKIDNGKNTLYWRRDSHGKNEKTVYQLNEDKPMVKVGRTQLPEVVDMFNITDVRLANGSKEKINFWYQGDAPFLTNKTAGQLFGFLSQSSCDQYISVVKQLAKDSKSQQGDINSTTANINALKNINEQKKDILNKNKGFDDLYIRIVTLNNEIEEYNILEQLVERYESCIAKKHIKSTSLAKIQKTLNEVNFESLTTMYNDMYVMHEQVEKIKYIFKSLTTKKEARISKTQQLEAINTRLYPLNIGIANISDDITELIELADQVKNIRRSVIEIEKKKDKVFTLNGNLANLEQYIGILPLKEVSTKLLEIESLDNQVKNFKNALTEYEHRASILKSKTEQLNNVSNLADQKCQEFEAFKDEIGVCPYCNSHIGG